MKLTEAFRNFEEAPKKFMLLVYYSKTAMFLKLVHCLAFLNPDLLSVLQKKVGKMSIRLVLSEEVSLTEEMNPSQRLFE
jgi:hypothetical protein